MKWMLIKYSQYPHWDKIQLFIQEFDVWKMWFFWKMRLEKCEFEEKKRLWKCEFCQKWDFQNMNFWINCGFLPQVWIARNNKAKLNKKESYFENHETFTVLRFKKIFQGVVPPFLEWSYHHSALDRKRRLLLLSRSFSLSSSACQKKSWASPVVPTRLVTTPLVFFFG